MLIITDRVEVSMLEASQEHQNKTYNPISAFMCIAHVDLEHFYNCKNNFVLEMRA